MQARGNQTECREVCLRKEKRNLQPVAGFLVETMGFEPPTSAPADGARFRGTNPPDRSRSHALDPIGPSGARCPLYQLGELMLPRAPHRSPVRIQTWSS